ncbi:MAG: tetratricopeptide repeat protein [Acidobacteriaceae bacterium]
MANDTNLSAHPAPSPQTRPHHPHLVVLLLLIAAAPFTLNAEKDFSQLQATAEKGSVPHEIELAAAYFAGKGVTQNPKLAAYWYEKAAAAGDPAAQNEIGFFYQAGIGVSPDPSRAFRWYQLSAAAGYIKAKVNLAVLSLFGIGAPKNPQLASQLLREAANAGDSTAATYLGDMFYLGLGIPQDKSAAEQWYLLGIRRHNPVAAYDMASLLSVETGHPHDLPRAVTLLRTSAAGGYLPALHSLGLLLLNNPNLAQSPQEARSVLETASAAGSWRSSVALGRLARHELDLQSAYYCFQLAILQGGPDASHLVTKDLQPLAAQLAPEQRRAAIDRAHAWFALHPYNIAFTRLGTGSWSEFPGPAITVPNQEIHAGRLVFLPPSSPDSPQPNPTTSPLR